MTKPLSLFLLFSCTLFASSQIEDPYRWLEEMESPQTLEWVEKQNTIAEEYLTKAPEKEWIKEKLKEVADYESYGLPVLIEDRIFFTRRNRGDELHHITMQEVDGSVQILVKADSHIPISEFKVSDDGKKIAYSISRGGSDNKLWKFMNVETGEPFLDEIHGILFSSPVWSKDHKGVYYINFTEAGIYYHELGKNESTLLYQMEKESDQLLLVYLILLKKFFFFIFPRDGVEITQLGYFISKQMK